MILSEICEKVIAIEGGLLHGEITFEYDNLMSAMKGGHPMEILDDILANIFWDVQAGKEPSEKALRKTLKEMKSFRRAFKVKELAEPIKLLEEYITAITPPDPE